MGQSLGKAVGKFSIVGIYFNKHNKICSISPHTRQGAEEHLQDRSITEMTEWNKHTNSRTFIDDFKGDLSLHATIVHL